MDNVTWRITKAGVIVIAQQRATAGAIAAAMVAGRREWVERFEDDNASQYRSASMRPADRDDILAIDVDDGENVQTIFV